MEKSLVVFVHGLDADDEDWWGSTESSLRNNPPLTEKYDIRFFSYKTDKIKTILNDVENGIGLGEVQPLLGDIGAQLSTYLKHECKNQNHSSIKLFGHSMGGLVIGASLQTLEEHHRDIYDNISSIAFAGTPLGGSSVASVLKRFLGFIVSSQTKSISINAAELLNITSPLPNYLTIDKTEIKKHLVFFRIGEDEVVSKDEERYGIFSEDRRNLKPHEYTLTGKHSESVQNLDANSANFKEIKEWILDINHNKTPEMETITYENFLNDKLDISQINEINIFAHTGKNTIERIRYLLEKYGYHNIEKLTINILVKEPLEEELRRYEQINHKLKLSISEFQRAGIFVNISYYNTQPIFQSIICKTTSNSYIAYLSFYTWSNLTHSRKTKGNSTGYFITDPKNNLLFQTSLNLFNHLFKTDRIHTIIFDFDDTLMNTFSQQIDAWVVTFIEIHKHYKNYIIYITDKINTFLEQNDKDGLTQEIKNIFKETYTNRQRYEYFFKRNINQTIIDEIENMRFSNRKKLTLNSQVFNGVQETLEILSDKYYLVIISSTTETLIRDSLRKNKLDTYFSLILGRDSQDYDLSLEEKSLKILKVSNIAGISLNRILFIGDSTTDYKASSQLGLKFIGVNIIASSFGKKTFIEYNDEHTTIRYEINTYENNMLPLKINEIEKVNL